MKSDLKSTFSNQSGIAPILLGAVVLVALPTIIFLATNRTTSRNTQSKAAGSEQSQVNLASNKIATLKNLQENYVLKSNSYNVSLTTYNKTLETYTADEKKLSAEQKKKLLNDLTAQFMALQAEQKKLTEMYKVIDTVSGEAKSAVNEAISGSN